MVPECGLHDGWEVVSMNLGTWAGVEPGCHRPTGCFRHKGSNDHPRSTADASWSFMTWGFPKIGDLSIVQ